MKHRFVTAFAPASVGNVAVGFDVLGHAFPVIGDRVRATPGAKPGVRITAVTGITTELPLDAAANTAGRAAQSLLASQAPNWGVDLEIEKGIPLGSGLGGSAASAVAAVVAVNELLDRPLARLALLSHAIEGEAVASGARHADNVAASLLGGLVLTVGGDQPRCVQVPVPAAVRCVLVHPRLFLSTRAAREMLQPTVPLADLVRQSANLAGFLAGCHSGDLSLIRACFEDVVIEPQRARLIPGFGAVKGAALANRALGCSISGAGPSVFAWCEAAHAEAVRAAMCAAFAAAGLECDHWIAPVGGEGATILERG
jgi:homoserine kinase